MNGNPHSSYHGWDLISTFSREASQFIKENSIAFMCNYKLQEGLHARVLANLIGKKLMSMFLAIGPVAKLMTRSMYLLLNT